MTCLPADSLDRDCHVVNLVWLPECEKWAMIDSDMQSYVASPEGEALSLEEMRQRTVAGEPMTVHRLLGTRDPENYLSYWAKNLYWFICWEQTGYDKEVGYEGRAIAPAPPGSRDSRWMNPSRPDLRRRPFLGRPAAGGMIRTRKTFNL